LYSVLNLVLSSTSIPQTGSIIKHDIMQQYLRFISINMYRNYVSTNKVVQKLTEIEYRVLDILKNNSRLPVSEIAKELGVSRATVSRAIRSLEAKGVRFTVDFPEYMARAFVITRKPQGEEYYRLIDGRFMVVLKGRSMDELVKSISELEDREEVFITIPSGSVRPPADLTCDYCGGPVNKPLIYRRWRKTYYVCCRTCLRELKKRLNGGEE